MDDLISKQAALDVCNNAIDLWEGQLGEGIVIAVKKKIEELPSAQPEQSIPILWIEKQIDWLKSMDNEFSNITAMNISTLVKKWRKENGKDVGSD